jgi:hypothetical protein
MALDDYLQKCLAVSFNHYINNAVTAMAGNADLAARTVDDQKLKETYTKIARWGEAFRTDITGPALFDALQNKPLDMTPYIEKAYNHVEEAESYFKEIRDANLAEDLRNRSTVILLKKETVKLFLEYAVGLLSNPNQAIQLDYYLSAESDEGSEGKGPQYYIVFPKE